jgi:hypothetical protein
MMKKISLILMVLALLSTACEDLIVQNLNEPDRKRALSKPEDLIQILKGGTMDALSGVQSIYGVHMQLAADQLTATNKWSNFWDFCNEPRIMFNNNTTYFASSGQDGPYTVWSLLNSGVNAGNTLIKSIENDKMNLKVGDQNRTTDALAGAYFIRGFCQGFIGVIFDQGYIMDVTTDLGTLKLKPYGDLIKAGLTSIEKALSIADTATNFKWDFMIDQSFDKARFKQLCNSFRAKIAISEPRTKAEVPQTPWATISTWADAGLTTDWIILTPAGQEWASDMLDYACTIYPPPAWYIPSDQKVFHLVNPTQYQEYYSADTGFYHPVSTVDQRIYGKNGNKPYYVTFNNFGYLRSDRNRYIFSNHGFNRWEFDQWQWNPGAPNPMFLAVEGKMIKAECALKQNNIPGVVSVINDPLLPRKKDGHMPDATATTEAQALWLLHYEYSVELDESALCTGQWAFMRRWDLLQKGTMTMWPIPAKEMEATGLEIYTFGGEINAGKPGTAAGPGWRTKANGQ